MSMKRTNVDLNNNNNNNHYKKSRMEEDIFAQIQNEIQVNKPNQGQLRLTSFSLDEVINKIIDMSAKKQGLVEGLEVEGRIGLLTNQIDRTLFKPGMILEDWDMLYKDLLQTGATPSLIKEVDYIYHDCRIVVDDETKQILRKENKVDKSTYDQSTNLVYDLRLSLSFEQQQMVPIHLPLDHTSRRIKKRYCFHEEDWKIDLTYVIVHYDSNPSHPEEHIYEVEVELLSESMRRCANKTTLTELLTKFINRVKSLISKTQSDTVLSFSDIQMDKVLGNEETRDIREKIFEFIPTANRNRFDTFPGSMPVNFSKKCFRVVQMADYYVSEKTDGIRYMLLSHKQNCYLIDRKFEIYSVKGSESLIGSIKDGTLLDGEMIRNLQTRKAVFLVFDIMAYHNEVITDRSLTERLSMIGNKIILPIRSVNPDKLPFSVIGKSFQKKAAISKVFSSITEGKGDRVFNDGKRCHHTDGIIFTPDLPYMPYTVQTLFKWKYLDKWTIDFKLKEKLQQQQKKLYLTCTGNGDMEIECREAIFCDADKEKLKKEFLRARDPNCIIAECSFQPKLGTWKFHQVRHDKIKGNYISIVMDTMESIAENLTQDEIKYRIPLRPEQDNWDNEFEKLKSQMIKQMRPGSNSSSPYSGGSGVGSGSTSSSSSNSHRSSSSSSTSEHIKHQQHQQSQPQQNPYSSGVQPYYARKNFEPEGGLFGEDDEHHEYKPNIGDDQEYLSEDPPQSDGEDDE
eukprot:gene10660-13057_t